MEVNYPYLRAWHQWNRAHGAMWTMDEELAHAMRTKASQESVYYEKGRWVTVWQIEDEDTKEAIIDLASG